MCFNFPAESRIQLDWLERSFSAPLHVFSSSDVHQGRQRDLDCSSKFSRQLQLTQRNVLQQSKHVETCCFCTSWHVILIYLSKRRLCVILIYLSKRRLCVILIYLSKRRLCVILIYLSKRRLCVILIYLSKRRLCVIVLTLHWVTAHEFGIRTWLLYG